MPVPLPFESLALQFVNWSNDRLLLLVTLPIAIRLGRSVWQRTGDPESRLAARLAAGIWLCLMPWLAFTGVGYAAGINLGLWAPTLDRLLGVGVLTAVAWVVAPPARGGGRSWRLALAAGLGLSIVVYLIWAGQWANAFLADPRAGLEGWAAAFRHVWDGWQLVLAGLAAWLAAAGAAGIDPARRDDVPPAAAGAAARLARIADLQPRPPRWLLVAVGCLVAGHVLQVFAAPDNALLAVWSRLGVLVAGLIVVAAAVGRSVDASVEQRPAETGTHAAVGRAGVSSPAADDAPGETAFEPMDGWPGAVWAPLVTLIHDQTTAIQRLNRVLERLTDQIEPAGAPPAPRAVEPAPRLAEAAPIAGGWGEIDVPALAGIDLETGAVTGAWPPDRGLTGRPPAAIEMGALANDLLPDLTEALRAPISSILGYSDVLTQGGGLREEQVKRYLYRINANLTRLKVMVDNVLTVIALPERSGPSTPVVDVSQCIRDAVDRTAPQFQEKGLAVRLALDESLPATVADRTSMTRIIDNLLVNATQRSPQGGDVTVSASVESAPDPLDDTVVITVLDRGRRIASPAADDGDDTDASTRVVLSIVRYLAEHQGGQAWAASDLTGTGFHVKLPLRRTA